MVSIDPISIRGLREFARDLKVLDADLPKALKQASNEAGELIVAWARPRVPKRSGKAARSVRVRSTRTQARVVGGNKRTPYYPWLDFGGRVGRSRSIRRPFLKEGRFIYPGFMRQRDEINEVLVRALLDVARQAGVTD